MQSNKMVKRVKMPEIASDHKDGANLALHPAKPREAPWGTAEVEFIIGLKGEVHWTIVIHES